MTAEERHIRSIRRVLRMGHTPVLVRRGYIEEDEFQKLVRKATLQEFVYGRKYKRARRLRHPNCK